MVLRTGFALLVLFGTVRADLEEALTALRAAGYGDRADAVRAVLALEPDRDEVIRRLRKPLVVHPLESGWHDLAATDEKGVARPLELYIPASLQKDQPVPLLVHMHGGVAGADFRPGISQRGYASLWVESAEKEGFVLACPLGRGDCVWWSAAGAANVRAAIREAKRHAPVDDAAVVGTGFSDGGSGCFYLAMAAPDPFAAFIPMNGHPAVASRASGEQLYLGNLRGVPLFVAMTQDDPLYPAKTVLPHLEQALEAGALLHVVSYPTGGHRPVYFEEQRPAFVRFLADTPRDPSPGEIDWQCASPETGRFRWIEILDLGPVRGDAEPLPDRNVTGVPGRVRLGLVPDGGHEGPGVRVERVLDGTTAARIGIEAGDVVVGMDGAGIGGFEELRAALEAKRFDQPVRVTVRRGEGTLDLDGRIPPFVPEPDYRRDCPTARVSVEREGDVVRAVTRNVRRFRLLLTGDAPVRVQVNGQEVAGRVSPLSLETILRRYAAEADAERVYVREMIVDLPPP